MCCTGRPCAAPRIARDPSVQRVTPGARIGRRAVSKAAEVEVPGNTTARVSATRARATTTGTLSLPSPRVLPLRVPCFLARRPTGVEHLKLRRKYVSSASTIPLKAGCSAGVKNAMTLCRQRHAVLWSTSMRAAALRVESPSRIVSAYARHFSGKCVPAIAVCVGSLNVRRHPKH